MASMQIVSGAGPAGQGKTGNAGGLDPVLMGLSPEAATGNSGESSTPEEHPFASELAAALASLDAQHAQALADNLLDAALQDGQVIDPTALSLADGQNLPIDPCFQNAILASFAALNGAMVDQSGVSVDDSASALLAAQANALDVVQNGDALLAAGPDIAADLSEMSGEFAQVSQGPASSELAAHNLNTSGSNLVGLNGAGSTAASGALVSAPSSSDIVLSPAGVASGVAANATTAAGQSATETAAMQNQQVVDSGPKSSSTAAGHIGNPGGGDLPMSRQAQQGGAQGQSQSGGSQDQAAAAAALTEAARMRTEKEASEYSGKQTSLAGSPVSDVGNVVVSAKPNAEGVAAAADAARQSALRVESSTAAGTQSVSQSSADALARADSKLEAARASLGTGPLNVEILKLTRQGGGRAVLEVTPPNQGPIRIDLQLDGSGRASLVVEGLSESMRARLESSAHFLRQDMAQMGLALNLEMRERNESGAAAQAFAQGQFGQSGQGGTRESPGGSRGVNTSAEGQPVGNRSSTQQSTAVDDGIHLVA